MDMAQEWVWLNNEDDKDADKAAEQANLLRSEAFWEVWRDVQRDLGYQRFVGEAVQRIHSAIGLAASRREEKLPVARNGSFDPTPEQELLLGDVDVRTATPFALRYGGRVLTTVETWVQGLFRERQLGAPVRWISVVQLMCSYIRRGGQGVV